MTTRRTFFGWLGALAAMAVGVKAKAKPAETGWIRFPNGLGKCTYYSSIYGFVPLDGRDTYAVVSINGNTFICWDQPEKEPCKLSLSQPSSLS